MLFSRQTFNILSQQTFKTCTYAQTEMVWDIYDSQTDKR